MQLWQSMLRNVNTQPYNVSFPIMAIAHNMLGDKDIFYKQFADYVSWMVDVLLGGEWPDRMLVCSILQRQWQRGGAKVFFKTSAQI